MITRLGPHDLTGLASQDVRRWAQKSRITKSVGNTAAIQAGGVIKVYRWPFSEVEQSNVLDHQLVDQMCNSILAGLAGFRAENLYVELLNEVGKGRRDQYVRLCKLAIPQLHAQGLKVAGPSWATGDYEQEDWDAFKGIGFDAIALHAYWSTAGFTPWNAFRWETYWKPGDPPVIVTETGRDRVRDGNPNVNDGWLPTDNSGSYGWQAASQQCSADQYLDELVRYDGLLESGQSAIGAVVFTSSPTQDWKDKGFSTDDIAGRLADLTAPEAILWAPEVIPPPAPTPTPGAGSVPNTPTNKPALPDLCPFATYTPLTRNFDTEGTAPKIVVWHGTGGLGDPFNWWNRVASPNEAASADFWIKKDGTLKQYVKLVSQTSWSNGPLVKPDLSVPFIAWLVAYKKKNPGFTGNWWTLSIEFEKDPNNADPLTAAQIKTGNKLARWLLAEFAIPLDRQHHLGHYQFDSVSRARCPRLSDGEWAQLLAPAGKLEPQVDALRDQLWVAKDTAWALGRTRLGDDVMTAVRRDKGEID